MFKLKLGLIISLLSCSHADAIATVNLCLTGKIQLTLPNYKLPFLNAVQLAFDQSKESKNFRLKTYFFDNKPLSAIRAYKRMMRDRCSAIIGFEYLSDLLLVIKQQKNGAIPIFTSYASSNDGDQLPKNIFLFAPSYDYQAKKMMAFLSRKFPQFENVLVITEVDRSDLSKYKIAYTKILTASNVKHDIFDFIGNDPQFDEKLNRFVSRKEYKYVFVFSGAVGSTKIINQLNNNKIIFIGTENFGSSSNQSLFVRLKRKKIAAFSIRNIDFLKMDNKLSEFKTMYIDKYHSSPSPLSAYTYDATTIMLNSFKLHHAVTPDAILNTNYSGVTGAYVKNKQYHRSHQYVILSIGQNGFIYEE